MSFAASAGAGDDTETVDGPITISQVAKRARVSTATVSRVLSGSAVVNAEMVDRVRKAADQLGYRPNATARGLAMGSHQMTAIVVPDLGNPYFNDVIKVINALAHADGQRIVVADSDGDPDTELDIVNGLSAQADGMILLSSRLSAESLKALARRRTPVVLVNRVEFGVDLPVVAVDNFSAMLELCGHLLSLGHRKVAYVAGSPLTWQNRDRWRGVQQAAVLGLQATLVQADATVEAGYAACDEALRSNPTAVICFNDRAAVGVLSRLQELGLSVPGDISVTGFDDIDLSKYVRPVLTTVRSPKNELGEQAWRLINSPGPRLEGPLMIKATFLARESTGQAQTYRMDDHPELSTEQGP